jgi:hypothetical protein
LKASVVQPKGEAIIDLDIAAVNGRAGFVETTGRLAG